MAAWATLRIVSGSPPLQVPSCSFVAATFNGEGPYVALLKMATPRYHGGVCDHKPVRLE